ncbi:T9SS C-terminal target domain-containing protein [Chitinophaga lutea]|uniref:T9SS C-terminal target domain-containing protein n=1 Tax=Chitinophaga lutea TaxID=2488634 RepID=A0A3N4QK18_9BACT|nr:discoidin domain-containing protein [Chitinophaga lutea]RPE12114.1 T9SS C-terminal target domain-containing protein [Chitinophaga lutea]
MSIHYLLRGYFQRMACLFFLLLSLPAALTAQVTAVADGPGNTYELLDDRGYNVESPDCGHAVRHITEVMDATLGKYVFAFTLHRDLDDDRCGATDRQRIELRGKGSEQQGTQGSTSYYRWKFKLDANFGESPNFTHIMQLKAYGNGHGSGAPILHLTPRYDNQMEIGHPGSGGVKASADLNLFRGVWVEIYVKIKHDNNGTLDFVIKRLSDGVTLLSYTNSNIDMWEDGAGYGAPKFGLYRSLNSPSYLRDETVYFADICVTKGTTNLCPSDVGSNAPPTVSMTAPTNGATFSAPATVNIAANASDSDGSITKVEFFEGSNKLGEDLVSPYNFSWSGVAAGSYSLTAKATDNAGGTKTSTAVNITVNAPPGCTPVSASADDGNVPANVLDNNLATRWSASGDGQWIQFCLGATAQMVNGVKIAFYSGDTRRSNFDIQLSQDGTSWTNAATGLQSSGTSLNLETFSFTAASAKYVRILGHGNTVNAWNSYTEVQVQIAPPPGCQPVTASADDGNVAANVLDNDLNTRWSASGDGQWIQFCLGATAVTVNNVQIAFYNGNLRRSIFDIQLSQDGTSWTNAATGLQSSGTSLNLETFAITPASAKYVRILGHGNTVNAWNSYTEVKINTGTTFTALAKAAETAEESEAAIQLTAAPNPFSSQTNISFFLQRAGQTRLAVFDMSGRPVTVLINAHLSAGRHTVPFRSEVVPAGNYVLKLEQGGKAFTKKVQKY